MAAIPTVTSLFKLLTLPDVSLDAKGCLAIYDALKSAIAKRCPLASLYLLCLKIVFS